MTKEVLKKYILTGIIILTLVEAYFYYRALKDYIGIYQTGLFIPLLLQPILYRRFFMNEEKMSPKNWKLIALGTISLVLPLLIYFTLPNYTYSEGKDLVQKLEPSPLVFLEMDLQFRSIPTTSEGNGFFINNRIYHYKTEVLGIEKYFVVHPYTGGVQELLEDFYRTK